MKETIIQAVLDGMRAFLTDNQLELLTDVTRRALSECEITPKLAEEEQRNKENAELLGAFISSKKVEGCSDKTIHYYKSSIEKLIATVKKNVCDISTNDIRCYLAEQQEQRGLSKVTSPSSMLMGDAGSRALGFYIAILAIEVQITLLPIVSFITFNEISESFI